MGVKVVESDGYYQKQQFVSLHRACNKSLRGVFPESRGEDVKTLRWACVCVCVRVGAEPVPAYMNF